MYFGGGHAVVQRGSTVLWETVGKIWETVSFPQNTSKNTGMETTMIKVIVSPNCNSRSHVAFTLYRISSAAVVVVVKCAQLYFNLVVIADGSLVVRCGNYLTFNSALCSGLSPELCSLVARGRNSLACRLCWKPSRIWTGCRLPSVLCQGWS